MNNCKTASIDQVPSETKIVTKFLILLLLDEIEPESEPSSELDSSKIQDISSLVTEPFDNPELPSLITGQCSNPEMDQVAFLDDLSEINSIKEKDQIEGTEKSCIGGNGENVEAAQPFNDTSMSYDDELSQKEKDSDTQVSEVTPGDDEKIDTENTSNTGSEHMLSALRPTKDIDKMDPTPNQHMFPQKRDVFRKYPNNFVV